MGDITAGLYSKFQIICVVSKNSSLARVACSFWQPFVNNRSETIEQKKMIDAFVKLEECINNCLLSRLLKPSHEKDFHSEYQIRANKLEQYFPKLLDLVENVDFREQPDICSSTLYSLLILFMELKTEGPWNTENFKAKNYSQNLNLAFKTKYNITLEEVLLKDTIFNSQEVFDKCIRELHQKMTLDDFKKYPSLVEVYCLFINNLQVCI